MNQIEDYFPELNQKVLQSMAQGWANQFKIIKEIRLCRSIDAAYESKYVVILEHSEEPDHKEIRRFDSNLNFDAGSEFFCPSFENVYKTGPEYRFRHEWFFLWKNLQDEFPDFVDGNNSWSLFPAKLKKNKPKTSGKNGMFLCIEGTTWEDIRITLIDNEMVRVETPSKKGRFTYHQLGMQDKRRGDQPTQLWALLVLFAKNQGVISLQDYELSKDRLYKAGSNKTVLFDCAKRLNSHLKELFGIEESIYKAHYRKKRRYDTRIVFSDRTQVV